MMMDAIPGWGGVERKEGMEWNEWTGSKAGNVRMVESKSKLWVRIHMICLLRALIARGGWIDGWNDG